MSGDRASHLYRGVICSPQVLASTVQRVLVFPYGYSQVRPRSLYLGGGRTSQAELLAMLRRTLSSLTLRGRRHLATLLEGRASSTVCLRLVRHWMLAPQSALRTPRAGFLAGRRVRTSGGIGSKRNPQN